MSIDAIALVRIPGWKPDPHVHAIALDDAFLVPTTAPFSSEPDELGLALRHRLGEELDRHDDPRGVFMLPDVASPSTKAYDAVIEEIGEAGVWAPIVTSGHVPERLANATPGSFDALAGQLLSAIGGDTLAAFQQAMMSGDAEALERVQQQMLEGIAKVGDPEKIAQQLMASMPGVEAELQAIMEGGPPPEDDSTPPEEPIKKR